MFRPSDDASTGRLIQLCLGYFLFYVITGISVKYFLGSAEAGFPGMSDLEFLFYSTLGSNILCLGVVFALGWHRVRSTRVVAVGRWRMPSELLYIIPSGICTAVVIPSTTLMYTLPISVMVAMVIMRGSVIVISRIVDAVQIRRGILKRKVYGEENAAVVFSILAVGVHLVGSETGGFEFLRSGAAMAILGSYIVAYAIRIYIMNYFKNTRPRGALLDNQGFFAVEQISATVVLLAVAAAVIFMPGAIGLAADSVISSQLRGAMMEPRQAWSGALVAGMAFGAVAFFSVFIFMFKGRTATFAGLVNRLTSLVAGTTATLVFAVVFGGKFPKILDWISLALILVAVAFLTRAERRRTQELAAAKAAERLRPLPSELEPAAALPLMTHPLKEPGRTHENPVRL